MKIKRRHRKISGLIKKFFTLLCIGTVLFITPSFSLAVSDLDYFKGTWVIKLRNNPDLIFKWTVKTDLKESWLTGVVEQNTARTSMDFWRQTGKKIERFAFTENGVAVKLESPGWEGNKMLMSGIMNDKSEEAKVRETITKVSAREFNALWEMENKEGKWVVFGDEICTKQS